MKIILIQNLLYISKEKTKVRCYIKKFDSDIKPCIGDLIELPSFNGHRQFSRVKQISLKFCQNECRVIVEDLITNELSDMKDYIHILINKGWERSASTLT